MDRENYLSAAEKLAESELQKSGGATRYSLDQMRPFLAGNVAGERMVNPPGLTRREVIRNLVMEEVRKRLANTVENPAPGSPGNREEPTAPAEENFSDAGFRAKNISNLAESLTAIAERQAGQLSSPRTSWAAPVTTVYKGRETREELFKKIAAGLSK